MRERWKLLLLVAVFAIAYFTPVDDPRVQGAVLEAQMEEFFHALARRKTVAALGETAVETEVMEVMYAAGKSLLLPLSGRVRDLGGDPVGGARVTAWMLRGPSGNGRRRGSRRPALGCQPLCLFYLFSFAAFPSGHGEP